VEMYLDGALVGSTGNWHGLTDIAITTANNGSNNVTIAGLQHSDKYNGLVHIDEVRIYDHALSLAEIESLAIVDPVTLTWTGAGDGSSFADEANWDQLPSTGTIDLANLRDHYIIADPTANLPAVSGITFAGGSLSISDGSMNMGTAGINGGGGAAVTVTGGSLANQFFSVNTAVTLGGDGTITLNGGGVPVNASTVDFTSTTAALQFNDETPDAVRTEHLSKFTVNGDPAVEGVNLIITPFNDVLGARVQAIPEPSALALLAVGLSWLVGLRRRS